MSILSEDEKKEFKKLTDKLTEFLCNRCNPHTNIVITQDSAELNELVISNRTEKYIQD